MLKQIWQLIPKKIFIFLILLNILSYIAVYLSDYFTNINRRIIDELNIKIEEESNKYSQLVKENLYQATLQFLALDFIYNNRKKIDNLVNEVPKYLPKILTINSVVIDNKNNYLEIRGSVNGWINYAMLRKYFEENKDIFENFKINSFSFNPSGEVIDLSLSFNFKK